MIPALIVAAVAVVIVAILVRELVSATRWGRVNMTRVEELELQVERAQQEVANATGRAEKLAAEAAAATETAAAEASEASPAVGPETAAADATETAAAEATEAAPAVAPERAEAEDEAPEDGPPLEEEPAVAEDGARAAGVPIGPLGPLLTSARSTLDALWSLAQLELERGRRDANAMSTASEPAPIKGLLPSLAEEVSRVREETGTPGTLRTSLETEPTSGVSVMVLRGVQALLAAIGRHCQAYDLTVYPAEGRLIALVVCDGFDGPDAVGRDATAVLDAVRPAGGDLALDRDAQGRLRAHLSIPTIVS